MSNTLRKHLFQAGLIGATLLATAAQAHESFLHCFDNGDDTVTCKAGYEDGSRLMSRDRLLVKDEKGKTLQEGHFDKSGSYSFERPAGNFMMVFMGSEIGHTMRINSADLKTR